MGHSFIGVALLKGHSQTGFIMLNIKMTFGGGGLASLVMSSVNLLVMSAQNSSLPREIARYINRTAGYDLILARDHIYSMLGQTVFLIVYPTCCLNAFLYNCNYYFFGALEFTCVVFGQIVIKT